MNRFLLLLLLSLALSSAAFTQQPVAPSPQKSPTPTASDYSQEPFVIEQYYTSAAFENDGTGVRDLSVRIRVQSEAGVQQLGELVFGFNSANEQMDVRYA